jgi:secretion/DNA translocation related CpaE-like protein
MTTTPGVLAIVSDTGLRDEVDRVAAAVGLRVVHVGAAELPSRRGFSSAAAVLLDEPGAVRCAKAALPRRPAVILLSGAEPVRSTWQAAVSIGAEHVLALPQHERELVTRLSNAGDPGPNGLGSVVAVVGGRGGAGASTFAAALALTAGNALLVDVDPWGGGLDLLIGGENEPGLRWPDLAVEGGRLNFTALREALPSVGGVSVLSGTRCDHEIETSALGAVVDAARRADSAVICDLPRRLTPGAEAALDAADLVVVVAPCEVRASAATASMAPTLAAINPNVGLVVRGPSPGGLSAREVSRIAALPLLAAMRPQPRLADNVERGGLRLPRRSPLSGAARRVLTVLQPNVGAAA